MASPTINNISPPSHPGPTHVDTSALGHRRITLSRMPFLDVVEPAFSFTSPEVFAAQEADWYADSPLGLIVLRYAESSELLRDRRLDHGGDDYLSRFGITSGPIHDWWVPMIVNHDGADHRRL